MYIQLYPKKKKNPCVIGVVQFKPILYKGQVYCFAIEIGFCLSLKYNTSLKI